MHPWIMNRWIAYCELAQPIVTFVFKDVTLIFFALVEYEGHVRNVIKKFNEENLNYCSFLKD